MNWLEISEKVERCNVESFEGINIGSVTGILSYDIAANGNNYSYLRGILKGIKRVINAALFSQFEYIFEKEEVSNKIFFFSHYIYRKDQIRNFKNVIGVVKNADVIFPNPVKKHMTIPYFVKRIPLFVKWVISLHKEISYKYLFQIMEYLIVIDKYRNVIDTIDFEKYKVATVYFDAEFLENYFLQLCKLKNQNIETVTLQHGLYIAERTNATQFEFSGALLKLSIADKMLTWNQATVDEAKLEGLEQEKFVLVGMPQYVGNNNDDRFMPSESCDTFGVVLSIMNFDEDNKKLLYAANYIARNLKCHFYVRYHPLCVGHEYDDIIDWNYCIKSTKKESLEDYCKKVKFSLVGQSTVYLELMHNKVKVYRLKGDKLYDKYSNININTFENEQELLKMLSECQYEEGGFEYLCFTDNPTIYYMNFYSEFD